MNSKFKDYLDSFDSVLVVKPREWYEAILSKFRNIKHGIQNIYQWFPVIWNDRWWDYYYILKLLEKKFNIMAMKFYKEGHLESAEERAETLMYCARLCKQLANNEYLADEITAHCEKYPSEWLEAAPETDKTILFQLVSSREQLEEAKDLFDREEKMWLKDKQTLFAIMNRELRNWSD